MPRSVPAYLQPLDFTQAPPGHRFSLYWLASEGNAKHDEGLGDVCAPLPEHSRRALQALRLRQEVMADSRKENMWSHSYSLSAPFATGLGNEHPSENGFAFLAPHGLPYLAGSGLKGALRRAATQLANGEWGDEAGWTTDAVNDLFGQMPSDSDDDGKASRALLEFWDVFFVPANEAGAKLHADIMTPHMRHYLQPSSVGSGDAVSDSPHPHGEPLPVKFLVIPPGWQCTLHVAFNARVGCAESYQGIWQRLLEEALNLACEWLGFGAKTAVGYGRLQTSVEDGKARQDRIKDVEQSDRAARRAAERQTRSDAQRKVDDFVEACEKKNTSGFKDDFAPNRGLYQEASRLSSAARADGAPWTAEERRELVEAFEEWLPKVVHGYDKGRAKDQLKYGRLRGTS